MSAAAPPGDRWEAGRPVSFVLASGRSGRGVVFAVDVAANRVVLDVEGNGVLMLNLDHVAKATFEQAPAAATLEPLPELTIAKATAREKQAFRAQEERLLRAGPAGTSKVEQEVFDTLSKTLDCRWNGHTIEVKNLGVMIKAPFRAQDVSGRDAKAVQRVQSVLAKILENREKLAHQAPAS